MARSVAGTQVPRSLPMLWCVHGCGMWRMLLWWLSARRVPVKICHRHGLEASPKHESSARSALRGKPDINWTTSGLLLEVFLPGGQGQRHVRRYPTRGKAAAFSCKPETWLDPTLPLEVRVPPSAVQDSSPWWWRSSIVDTLSTVIHV